MKCFTEEQKVIKQQKKIASIFQLNSSTSKAKKLLQALTLA